MLDFGYGGFINDLEDSRSGLKILAGIVQAKTWTHTT